MRLQESPESSRHALLGSKEPLGRPWCFLAISSGVPTVPLGRTGSLLSTFRLYLWVPDGGRDGQPRGFFLVIL